MNNNLVPCKYCGKQTRMVGSKMCDPCWELASRIKANPAMAAKILIPDLLPAGRPATKIEIEAVSAIANLQDELLEARKIIKCLLDVFPKHAFPEVYNNAKEFSIQHK
jgi:hypothetical protein